MADFQINGAMFRYSIFVPKFYNWCKSLGFEAGKIMPSRAFCSDESQGYPIILITKHFGTFPFNHGRVGGIVATDRHGPHAEHGQDMVIIQASHVGYDDSSHHFGCYKRLQTSSHDNSPSCGKVHAVLSWYINEYNFAKDNIYLSQNGKDRLITIDNQLLNENREEGLFLHLERIVEVDENGETHPIKTLSTAKSYRVSSRFQKMLGDFEWQGSKRQKIGDRLVPELFQFKRIIDETITDMENDRFLEKNLLNPMPWIVTSPAPLLMAAQVNTQVEFDRTFRTIAKEHGYRGKKLVFIAGLNIDISPQPGQLFPLTKFVPWAAYVQDRDDSFFTLEQQELVDILNRQSSENADQIDLEDAIHKMGVAKEVKVFV
ncbi:MAG: hypothetical protein OEY67_06695 [Gammaproteobacteria bacterium]|nr:hypothetical protein [Gammaproteobacteria bacterium]